MKYKNSLFIFRRDLRLVDNTALAKTVEVSSKTHLAFIFDPNQLALKNKYFSDNAFQFMLQSLDDLNQEVKKNSGKISFFIGSPKDIIFDLLKLNKIDAVFFNKDYTPFSIKRDKSIFKACSENIEINIFEDYLLVNPEDIKTQSGTAYKVFTSFYNQAKKNNVRAPLKDIGLKNKISNTLLRGGCSLKKAIKYIDYSYSNDSAAIGGRAEAKKILKKLNKFKNYSENKDFPIISTSRLSSHLKFGTVSIREAFFEIIKKLGSNHPLVRQLYWRDFFTYVAYHSPNVFGASFYKKYDRIKWSYDRKKFNKWCSGETGFPIVDAGMRELNKTGFMHNRVRMIAASFLVKDLHIDWRWGEKYFANKLIDYDPSVNNGNWQWAASTGCDAQPYFRIFNPWLQQKKFDRDCVYIKKWIPELEDLNPTIIHNWHRHYGDYEGYFKPMIDHAVESKLAKEMYRSI